MERDWLRNAIVEFVGTFALIFVGAGAIIATGGQNLVAIALAHGLAIGLMVAAAGHISGGVYNPALTVGLVAARRIGVSRGVYYIVAQLAGAAVAAVLLKAVFPAAAAATVNLGTPAVGSGVGTLAAVLAEVIMTFFLMYIVFGVAVDSRGARAIAGLAIGLTISMDIFVGGGLTGAAMNPARWFGPALVQGAFADWWIYWVGPIVGAMLAALLWNEVYLRGLASPRGRLGERRHRTDAGGAGPGSGPLAAATSSRRTAAAIASPTAVVVTVFSPGRAVSGVRMPSSIASSIAALDGACFALQLQRVAQQQRQALDGGHRVGHAAARRCRAPCRGSARTGRGSRRGGCAPRPVTRWASGPSSRPARRPRR